MFFFKLRLIIAEIEEIEGLMSLWELTFFLFFSLRMKLSWNYYVIDEIMRNGVALKIMSFAWYT